MSKLYVLYEHAAGYALFSVKEFEEISMFLPQVESSVTDISKFNSIVGLQGFSPFKTAIAALENINAISEGIVPQDLLVFLDDFFAKLKKKKCTLGISDAKLGAAITEAIGVQCNQSGVVPELLRGIRVHFHKLVKGFTDRSASVAQLGLAHSYSRSKIKFNVHNVDNMIIQSIALLDQLDKDLNTFAMRIREWYSYHFPELVKIVPDNFLYAKCAEFIKDRKTLTQDKLEALEEIVMDSAKAQAIIDAGKMSMGMDISIVDLINIEMFAKRVVRLGEYRQKLVTYLNNKMGKVAPNLQSLLGDQVSARLISNAGSLTNLAKFPASTVQILGAEKALFRALKTRSNTPKYGLLYHSSFIGRAALKNKGRIARFLANKCSIASRIDCFVEHPTNIFGQKLKEQVENRLKFYESGEVPAKNIDVMREAMQEAKEEVDVAEAKAAKKKNKKKKKLAEQQEDEATKPNGQVNEANATALNAEAEDGTEVPKKKNKKKKNNLEEQQPENEAEKPNGSFVGGQDVEEAGVAENGLSKKKNKKKRKLEQEQQEEAATANGNLSHSQKNENVADDDAGEANAADETGEPKMKKKKKKNKNKSITE